MVLRVIPEEKLNYMDPFSSNIFKRFIWIDIMGKEFIKDILAIQEHLEEDVKNNLLLTIKNLKRTLTNPFLDNNNETHLVISDFISRDCETDEEEMEDVNVEDDVKQIIVKDPSEEELKKTQPIYKDDDYEEESHTEEEFEKNYKTKIKIEDGDKIRCQVGKWLNDNIITIWTE